jgi:hypothetical protein
LKVRTLFIVVTASLATRAAAGPSWAPGEIKSVRVLDTDFAVVRVVTERSELDALGSWLARAEAVERRTGKRWTHKLDIDAPRGGRWLYDAAAGEFTVLSAKKTAVYRLALPEKSRMDALLVPATTTGSQPTESDPDARPH